MKEYIKPELKIHSLVSNEKIAGPIPFLTEGNEVEISANWDNGDIWDL